MLPTKFQAVNGRGDESARETESPVEPVSKIDSSPKAADEFDPFRPENLRIDAASQGPVAKKLLTHVPVRKPHRQDFIRVHPDKNYRLTAAVIELKEDREFYLIEPRLRAELASEDALCEIFTVINRQGVVFLWPVRLPGPDGRVNHWHSTAKEAAELAMDKWISVRANMDAGAYEIYEALGNLPDPIWPDVTFHELLKIAFRDRLVDSLDHPLSGREPNSPPSQGRKRLWFRRYTAGTKACEAHGARSKNRQPRDRRHHRRRNSILMLSGELSRAPISSGAGVTAM
jgi:hypothetical protein